MDCRVKPGNDEMGQDDRNMVERSRPADQGPQRRRSKAHDI